MISLWICDFNPFAHLKKNLPYYVFESVYRKIDGIEGENESFDFGNGVRYIFINGAYNWEKLEKKRPLSKLENALKVYVMDMRQVSADNIINDIARETFVSCKEKGSMIYTKMQKYLYHEYKEFYDNLGKQFEERTKKDMVKALYSKGVDINVISDVSGFSVDEIMKLEAN